MQSFLIVLIQCSVAMSVLILLFLAVTPLLRKRYTAKWRYYAWLVIVLGLIIPFRPHVDMVFNQINTPLVSTGIQQVISVDTGTDVGVATGSGENRDAELPKIPWYQLAGFLWLAGTATAITYHGLRHRRFLKVVQRWSEEITSQEIDHTLQKLKEDMRINRPVKLKVCSLIPSPMLSGFFRPVILLPSAEIAADDLNFMLKHELVHLKRHDLWYKALVLLASAIHWFNPVVYLMAKVIATECEISCDERILQGASFQERRKYGETILEAMKNGAKMQTVLTTNFYGGKKGMRIRILSLMDTTKRKAGVVILCVALLATIGIGVAFAADSPKDAVEGLQTTQSDSTITYGKLALPNGEYEGQIKNGLAHGQGTIDYWNGDKYVGSFLYGRESGKGMITQIIDGKAVTQEIDYPILTEVPKIPQDSSHRVPEPNDGLYHVKTDRPAGIIIYSITFHEGYRAAGMKAVDVHIMARSHNNENELVQGRDEIVSIEGSTGKVYSMIGTKRTAVNTNALFDNFQEQEITQYQDVSVDEKTITSIIVRRDGKLITIKPDKDTKIETTHP